MFSEHRKAPQIEVLGVLCHTLDFHETGRSGAIVKQKTDSLFPSFRKNFPSVSESHCLFYWNPELDFVFHCGCLKSS